jgi:hypothetical protein
MPSTIFGIISLIPCMPADEGGVDEADAAAAGAESSPLSAAAEVDGLAEEELDSGEEAPAGG